MRPIANFSTVQATGNFERLPAGGYVIRITEIQDEPAKQYLRVTYDIAEGEYKDHYKDSDADHVRSHQFIRSYKDTALGMFKAFTKAIDESNGTNYTEQVEKGLNEAQLTGKVLGVLIGEEEYNTDRGETRTGLKVRSCIPAERVRRGDFTVPAIKRLKEEDASGIPEGFTALTESDLPF